MKNIFKSITLLSLSWLVLSSNTPKSLPAEDLEGTISISGAFALYPMAVKWGEEFKKIHPKVRFDISAGGAGKGITDALAQLVDIGAVSRDIYPEEVKKGAFAIAVTKDAVIPTISASNPNAQEILSRGINRDEFYNIFATGAYKNWKQIKGLSKAAPIHVYTRSDAAGAAETWAKYFGKKQEDLLGVGVYGDPGLLQAVKKDPLAIGFNNISYAYDTKTKQPIAGVKVVPIDLNKNGKVDPEENFYNNLDQITDAIAAGKYPSPPARELLFVTHGKPQKKVVAEFIKWVLTEGQKYVDEAGYIKLSQDKLQAQLNKLK